MLIFNNSCHTGEISAEQKKVSMPIFKKNKRDDPSNYRLVSVI